MINYIFSKFINISRATVQVILISLLTTSYAIMANMVLNHIIVVMNINNHLSGLLTLLVMASYVTITTIMYIIFLEK